MRCFQSLQILEADSAPNIRISSLSLIISLVKPEIERKKKKKMKNPKKKAKKAVDLFLVLCELLYAVFELKC